MMGKLTREWSVNGVANQPASVGKRLQIDQVIEGRLRLRPTHALTLYREASLYDLGQWASSVCQRLHGDQLRTYVIDRNINYTNVCSAHCTFCAFKRNLSDQDAYVLSDEQLYEKIQQLVAIGGTQVLLQGGMHPELPMSFYENMLRGIKTRFPSIHVHAFSPPEFVEFVANFELDGFPAVRHGPIDDATWDAKLEAIMRRLRAAGLDSVPGGGGEIFAEHVRRRIGLGKATSRQWLQVMTTAHRLGLSTSATMMFGHIEGIADRIHHMLQIRHAQDLAISQQWPGRYLSFIGWPFQPENTPLGRLHQWDLEKIDPFPGDVVAEGRYHDQAGDGCASPAPPSTFAHWPSVA